MSQVIHFATGNEKKKREVQQFFAGSGSGITCIAYDLDIPEIFDLDHRAVAVDKACKAWAKSSYSMVLIEDEGVYFSRYHMFPGALTKHIRKSLGLEGSMRLIDDGDPAELVVYLVYALGPRASDCHVFRAACSGIMRDNAASVATDSTYASLFIPSGYIISYIQLREKGMHTNISPRISALRQLVQYLQSK